MEHSFDFACIERSILVPVLAAGAAADCSKTSPAKDKAKTASPQTPPPQEAACRSAPLQHPGPQAGPSPLQAAPSPGVEPTWKRPWHMWVPDRWIALSGWAAERCLPEDRAGGAGRAKGADLQKASGSSWQVHGHLWAGPEAAPLRPAGISAPALPAAAHGGRAPGLQPEGAPGGRLPRRGPGISGEGGGEGGS